MLEGRTDVLTIRQTASEYKFPEYAIRTLVKQKRFPIVQLGRRVYVLRHVFEEYLQSGGALYDPKKATGNK